jgi:hypothetical protein
LLALAALACTREKPGPQGKSTARGPIARKPPAPDPDALPAAANLPPARRALQVVNGEERIVDAERAAPGA